MGLYGSVQEAVAELKELGQWFWLIQVFQSLLQAHETLKFSIIMCLSLQKAVGKLQYIYNSCISGQRSV